MRLLVISPLFPPLADSEAFCGGKFVQGLIDAGGDPWVIYCSNVRKPLRVDTSLFWNSLEARGIDVPSPETLSLGARCWFALRYQTTDWARWTAAVVSKASEFHHRSPFDIVISRSLPWQAHLAGYWAASVLRLPWLANINDPWGLDFDPFLSREAQPILPKLHRNESLWKQRTLSYADVITFPCERLRDVTLRGSSRRSGVHVVPHIGAAARESLEAVTEFLIVHAGKLGLTDDTGRRAQPVLDGIADFFKRRPSAKSLTRLLFVGPEDLATKRHAAQLTLAETVTWTGQVTYEASLEHIARASVCLLIEGDFNEGFFLPSKLCDYVAARKPVLAVSPAVGTVNDMAHEGGILRVAPNDSKGVSRALGQLFDAFVGQRLRDYSPPESLARRYDAKPVIQEFLNLVTPLRSRGP